MFFFFFFLNLKIGIEQVYFGTTAGQLIVMDVHGAMVSEVQLAAGVTSMAWSAEKFTMEEGDDDLTNDRSHKGSAEISAKIARLLYHFISFQCANCCIETSHNNISFKRVYI